MRAVVLAAGRGNRLGELTRDVPKPLLCVGGEPVLVRIVHGLASAGVTRAAIVTGYRGEQIRHYFETGHRPGLEIAWFDQPVAEGTASALALARDFTGDAPFLFSWGDIVIDPSDFAAVAATFPLASLAVNVVDDPCEGGAVYVDTEGFVTRLVEKPARGTSTTRLNNAGFGVLPADIWDDIAGLARSARGEYDLPTAIASNIERGGRFRAVRVEGLWFDAGTPESLAAARNAFGGADDSA